MYDDGERRLTRSDRLIGLTLCCRDTHHVEAPAIDEIRDQRTALLAMREVQHSGRYVGDIERRRVAEYQHLDQRRHEKPETRPAVAPELDQLLDNDAHDPTEHDIHAIRLRNAREAIKTTRTS